MPYSHTMDTRNGTGARNQEMKMTAMMTTAELKKAGYRCRRIGEIATGPSYSTMPAYYEVMRPDGEVITRRCSTARDAWDVARKQVASDK